MESNQGQWLYELTSADEQVLEEAVSNFVSTDKDVAAIDRESFKLRQPFRNHLKQLSDKLLHGCGVEAS